MNLCIPEEELVLLRESEVTVGSGNGGRKRSPCISDCLSNPSVLYDVVGR